MGGVCDINFICKYINKHVDLSNSKIDIRSENSHREVRCIYLSVHGDTCKKILWYPMWIIFKKPKIILIGDISRQSFTGTHNWNNQFLDLTKLIHLATQSSASSPRNKWEDRSLFQSISPRVKKINWTCKYQYSHDWSVSKYKFWLSMFGQRKSSMEYRLYT